MTVVASHFFSRGWLVGLLCAVSGAVSCARPQFPSGLAQVTPGLQGTHLYELSRDVPGVGAVHERIISREPNNVATGACAGTLELAVPGAPGGAQYYTAHVGCPGGNSVQATRRDSRSGQVWLYKPTLDQMMRARGVVLAERGDGVRWFVPDAVYEGLSWSSVVHARGHVHADAAGVGVPLGGRQLVVALSMHSGFPGPRIHWDDVHVALLDERGNLLARLMLDPSDVGTHAGIQVRHAVNGDVEALAYVGLLRDAAGQWRFVDLLLPVEPHAVKAPTGVEGVINTVAVARTTQVVRMHPDKLGHLWVDGAEWLGVDALAGSVEQVFHRPGAVIGGDLSINPSPEQSPTWRTASVDTGAVRLMQDRTLLGDTEGLLLKLPPKARQGWSHLHELLDRDGGRAQGDGGVALAQMPYTSRVLRFPLPTGQHVKLVQELVGVTTKDGAAEYGLRQSALLER